MLLIARQTFIVLLVVISPLAFIAYLLPNTEKYFQQWRKIFTGLLLLFPIIGLLYGAAQLASSILLAAAGDDVILQVAAYLALVIPLFAIWPLLKGSMNAIPAIGNAIQGLGKRGSSAAQGGVKGGMNAYKNSDYGKFRAANKADRKARIATGSYVGAGGRLNPRNWRSAANKKLNDSRLFNSATSGFGGNRQLAAEAQGRKDQAEAIAMFGGDDELVAAWAETGGDMTQAAAWKNAKGVGLNPAQITQMQKMRDAGHHRKATSHLAAAQHMSESGKGSVGAIASALGNAAAAGATQTATDGAWVAAQAAYRKSGRGDLVGEMGAQFSANGDKTPLGRAKLAADPMTLAAERQAGWKQTDPATTHREAFATPDGVNSYVGHINSSKQNLEQALIGFDRMEGRAKDKADPLILAAAQSRQRQETGSASTITTIQEAKTYFNIK